MPDTAQLIEQGFRELIAQKHFRSVTVKEVCERAGVSRKTFYTHFLDKEAIAEGAFHRDVLQPVFDLGRLLDDNELEGLAQSVFGRMFRAVWDDGAYYRALVAPMRGNDFTFQTIATNGFHELYDRMLKRFGEADSSRNADYIVYYFAAAHAEFLQKWICEDYPVPPGQIAEVFVAVALPFWRSLGSTRQDRRSAQGPSSGMMRASAIAR